MPVPPLVLAVDLGKSRCRAVVAGPRLRVAHDGVGAPGLAAAEGVEAALAAIRPALDAVRASDAQDASPEAIAVGAAGAWAAPRAAADLARRLATEAGVPVVVTSDVVSAHAGALDGGQGVLLIAGTGAAALGITPDDAALVDGWGPELGDFGSGSWLGREALRAVLRAAAGLGPSTALTEALRDPVGDVSSVQAWLAQDDALARRLATLAPLVLDAAASGDDVAAQTAAEGVRLLTATAVAASAQSSAAAASAQNPAVALHGGLTDHRWFHDRLGASLHAAGLVVVPSVGDALDGARLLAERSDLPHERFVHRAE
ncbi:BadF/BadG/BcrA/BcrD ATPase family protein [Microbacterium sp. 3J1]|uniref:BadF/BadG/BcrA/BcrD ATPase family protein n=1 Tax=Microbacterium sp. 3J1 TaxID=861269 RepID=UPI000AAA378E|nr:BadF/BadG/BcrA/BcrD ATPase family protein [Microbacterium sp. 3J1]